ncbi:disintegrin and metalloproteinase domain-containing protein 33 isoform X10 [Homo sapiens]|uniref:disintegrin and metalloproteinase domain-containing protein 33 isoform X10 n=1 Tax=Homo sapiens TaxID=9606 RepID=UPI0003EAF7D6|nr:disintegrin and metalloproteinase domain-containing protein 33 isoform X10 [Homo sapiens]XP_054180031.1 disintegrin and metalloproteinase domain-containing protein 33 isoform X10 [Homo sapiens]|eukprot:XP_016883569.1 disintegrin and metalloproteinase domain-containing protein 33 isoform X7 [Homo sapiens]
MGWRPRRARGTPLLLLLLLLLLWPVPGAGVLQGHIPGQPVTPHWVLDGQPWRTVSLEEPVSKPDMGLVALEAEGQELLLELEKNHRLLAPGYIETHYGPDGQPVVLAPNHTVRCFHGLWDAPPEDHCHYQGRVRGFPDSWVVLCTCSGMSGLITLSRNASYYLRPWPPRGSKDFSTHEIFRMEQLLTWKGTCGHRDPGNKAGMTSLPGGPQSRGRREARRTRKYLELYIVADHTLFLTRHRNLNHTKQRLLEVANYVDQLLRTLDIQVALTGLEVWTERDRSRVTQDANATLWAFLQWRRGLWAQRPHDSAQLLTWVPLTRTRVPGGAASPPGPAWSRRAPPPGAAPSRAPQWAWRPSRACAAPRAREATTRSSPSAPQPPWPMRSATASASATTPTAAAWRLRPSPEAASWLRPPGTRFRACSAPAAAASCAPSSARGAALASPMPRTPDSRCRRRSAGTASWKRARSVTAALARSAATSAALLTTARCARGPSAPTGTAACAAWFPRWVLGLGRPGSPSSEPRSRHGPLTARGLSLPSPPPVTCAAEAGWSAVPPGHG